MFFNIILTHVFLCFAAFVSYIRQNCGLYVLWNPYWTCNVILVPFFGSSMSSSFFILSMTFERFYSIIRPHKATSFNTVKKAKGTILCIVIFIMIFNIPRIFLGKMEGHSVYHSRDQHSGVNCTFTQKQSSLSFFLLFLYFV